MKLCTVCKAYFDPEENIWDKTLPPEKPASGYQHQV